MFGKSKPIEIKSIDELALMRQAGLVVAKTLEKIGSEIAVGMTTADLDALARESIADHGATSSFLGYHGFPAVICASVNDEVVHGIPGERVSHFSKGCISMLDGKRSIPAPLDFTI